MESSFQPSLRLNGFDKPRVWSILTPLAQKLNAANLGQGFPTWSPPNFFLDSMKQNTHKSHHQYVRAYGSLPLVQSIAKFHQSIYPQTFPKISPQTDIVISNGGSEGLFCIFMGLLNEGDQVILFDPSYDCYRSQIQMSGGKTIGIPLKPKKSQSKQEINKRLKLNENNKIVSCEDDQWLIDFQAFQDKLNQKTKIVLINSPHNPVGKVFSQQEINRIAKILEKYPQVIIIQDNVYEGMIFDQMLGKRLPKIAFLQNFYPRTLSVYSAGKMFAATGLRSGWVLGPANLIKAVRSVHQYNVFCYYDVLQNTVKQSLDLITKPENTYMVDYAKKLCGLRNLLVEQLLNSKFDIDFWIPKGSNFIIVDISRQKIQQKYLLDEEGNKRGKDYAFALQLMYEQGVSVIPCSPFYSAQDQNLGQKYIRLTFCKDEEIIKNAGERIK